MSGYHYTPTNAGATALHTAMDAKIGSITNDSPLPPIPVPTPDEFKAIKIAEIDALLCNLAAGVEAWREVGAVGQPAFNAPWQNQGTYWTSCAFYKDLFGVVHLKGFIDAGTIGTVVFTLPAGYRPSNPTILDCTSNNAYGNIIVGDGGAVTINIGNAAWTCLDGISFRAA